MKSYIYKKEDFKGGLKIKRVTVYILPRFTPSSKEPGDSGPWNELDESCQPTPGKISGLSYLTGSYHQKGPPEGQVLVLQEGVC